jgi:hypothetical protein
MFHFALSGGGGADGNSVLCIYWSVETSSSNFSAILVGILWVGIYLFFRIYLTELDDRRGYACHDIVSIWDNFTRQQFSLIEDDFASSGENLSA